MTETAKRLLNEFEALSSSDQRLLLSEMLDRAAKDLPRREGTNHPSPIKPTPELIEWAKQQYTEEELMAGIEEIQRTGGLELRDFIQELEEIMADERNSQ